VFIVKTIVIYNLGARDVCTFPSGVFRISQRGGNPSLPFPPLPPPLPSLPFPSLPLPLEVGPLIAARGSGGAL